MPDPILAFSMPQFIASMTVIFIVINLALVAAAYFILLERRIAGWVQDRLGPNRVGPLGLFQPIADGLKLLLKEDYLPRGADRPLFILAPALSMMVAMIAFAIIPWAGALDLSTLPFTDSLSGSVKMMGADVNIGIIYLIAVTSLGVYGVTLGGWSSNNKYSFLGGLRASAQMVSYEIPMGLALLCVILTAGTVRADQIVSQQIEGQWFLIHQPLAAVLFYTCMLAEANRAPFDLAEAEQELVGGWHTEYSSMKWAMFFLGEYIHVFVGSAFFTVLFLGGWSLNPLFGYDLPLAGGIWMILLQFGIVLGKVLFMVILTMVVRWTLPRFRFDQLMRLAWEGMIPAGLLLLLVTSFFIFLGWSASLWLGSIAALAIILLVYPWLPRQANPNHRVGMYGSRFSPAPEDRQAAVGE
ncbi:MAG: NADH-quinone oxidoreductase subunit NuoH [Planctomycetota bacterium]|nr:NADH-quinone oxidoreductase subunit NuoH [Planctomycetota bacterium]